MSLLFWIHEGRTLLEYIAQQDESIDLLIQALGHFIHLAQAMPTQTVKGISPKGIAYQYLLFVCEKIADSQRPDKDFLIHATLPQLYDDILEMSFTSNNDIKIEPFPYFTFLPDLRPEFEEELSSEKDSQKFHFFPKTFKNYSVEENSLLHVFRQYCARSEIGHYLQDVDSIDHSHLTQMINNPLYSLSQDPLQTTLMKYQLSGYADILNFIHCEDISTLTLSQKQSLIEFLCILYEEGSPALQENIARHVNILIEENPKDKILPALLLITLAPAPLGRGLPRFRAKTTPLLSQLSQKSGKLLAKAVSLLIEGDVNNRHCYERSVMRINQHEKFEPNYKSDSDHSYRKLLNESEWMVFLVALGNFPQIKHAEIYYSDSHANDFQLMRILAGSEKMIIQKYYHNEDNIFLDDFTYGHIFSWQPPKFQIERIGECYLSRSSPVFRNALQLGIRNFILHEYYAVRSFDEILSFDQYNFLVGEEQIYFCFTNSQGVTCDLTLRRTGIMPGPLSLSSKEAMSNCKEILGLYGADYQYSMGGFKTKTFYPMPIICAHHALGSYIKKIQEVRKEDASENAVWVLSKAYNSAKGQQDIIFDLLVYGDRIELGPLTKMNCGNSKMAREKFAIPAPVKSLYLIAANKVASLPKDSLPAIPADLQEDIEDCKKWGNKPHWPD